MKATIKNLTVAQIRSAYQIACFRLECYSDMGAKVRREMCDVLDCEPWDLELALGDDAVIYEVMGL